MDPQQNSERQNFSSDLNALEETLYLERAGVLAVVRKREQDDSGFTNVDDLDWEHLSK